jgi:rhodanese-related sulfurtransferase
MLGRFVNLPFKVLGTVARAVQERDKAQRDKNASDTEQPDKPARLSLRVPDDFETGPIRIRAKRALAGPHVLVDVGTLSEWTSSRPAESLHIPAEEIDIRLAELPPSVPIIVIARRSEDSERVVRFLRHRGLDDTWSLHGGLLAFKRAGGATTEG